MIKKHLVLSLLIMASVSSYALQGLFYSYRDANQDFQNKANIISDLNSHGKTINIYSPQSYEISAEGVVYNHAPRQMIKIAEQHGAKIMPLVTNASFDQDKMHQLLSDPKAEQHAIQMLVQLCQQYHYYGLEIDFEHLSLDDRDAFTGFYQSTAKALHRAGFKISSAVIPVTTDQPHTPQQLLQYQNWTGGYDQKALAKAGDFMVLMTYNLHGGLSTPGPSTSVNWAAAVIKYSLTQSPANKLFLGIPSESTYWKETSIGDAMPGIELNGKPAHFHINAGSGIGYPEVVALKKSHHLTWSWDKAAKVHYAMFPYHFMNQFIFVEDQASYAALVKLAKQNNLGGVAMFALGDEDPGIWKVKLI